jgi:hypothetical protein
VQVLLALEAPSVSTLTISLGSIMPRCMSPQLRVRIGDGLGQREIPGFEFPVALRRPESVGPFPAASTEELELRSSMVLAITARRDSSGSITSWYQSIEITATAAANSSARSRSEARLMRASSKCSRFIACSPPRRPSRAAALARQLRRRGDDEVDVRLLHGLHGALLILRLANFERVQLGARERRFMCESREVERHQFGVEALPVSAKRPDSAVKIAPLSHSPSNCSRARASMRVANPPPAAASPLPR